MPLERVEETLRGSLSIWRICKRLQPLAQALTPLGPISPIRNGRRIRGPLEFTFTAKRSALYSVRPEPQPVNPAGLPFNPAMRKNQCEDGSARTGTLSASHVDADSAAQIGVSEIQPKTQNEVQVPGGERFPLQLAAPLRRKRESCSQR